MNTHIKPPLLCPVCKTPLNWIDTDCRCTNGHSFDPAKEGYLNLLLSHHRRSQNPGDDKLMIQARRRFFDSGIFDPVAQAIQNIIPIQKPFQLLDCGCGEGHFLGALSGQRIGIDISKEAIRCAAKRYPNATWIVANGMRDLPLIDHSLDFILSVLAPRNTEEFARVLKPDGRLILGVPGPNHLIELRTRLNPRASDFDEKADEAAAKCAPFFQETTRENLAYQTDLQKEQIADLIQMTPIFWNSTSDAKEKVQQHETLTITISFALITLRPAGNSSCFPDDQP